jgi:hypothetical protein
MGGIKNDQKIIKQRLQIKHNLLCVQHFMPSTHKSSRVVNKIMRDFRKNAKIN